MKNEDAQLVNRFLSGDEGAFTTSGKKIPEARPRPCMAQG